MSSFVIRTEGYKLDGLPSGLWSLRSPSGTTYTIDSEEGTCSCPDFRGRGHRRACKHLRGIWSLLQLCPWVERQSHKGGL